MRFVRIGRFYVNLDKTHVHPIDPLVIEFKGRDAETLRRHLRAISQPWRPAAAERPRIDPTRIPPDRP